MYTMVVESRLEITNLKGLMKKIHPTPPTQRYALGVPFEKLIHRLLRDGLSHTDIAREAVAEKWIRERGKLPKDCEDMLRKDE